MARNVKQPPATDTSATTKRPYRSVVRREHAAATRARIVEAAAALFLTNGYARTSVQAIAEAAQVAPDTIYATFGSKVRVLTAVIDARLAPPGVVNVMERPEAKAVRDATDQREQLRHFAADMAAVSTRVRPIFEVLRAAADAEPDVREVLVEMEQHRFTNMARLVEWLAARGPLAVDRDEAARTIWLLASPDVGRLQCDVLGRSEAEHAAWLERALAATLLVGDGAAVSPPQPRPRARRRATAPGGRRASAGDS